MATTEQLPAPTDHQPLARRVRPAEGQPTEIPIRWENTGVEEAINVEISHKDVALGAVDRVGKMRAGRFFGSRSVDTPAEKPHATASTDESQTPVVDYLESRGRQAKLGRKLMGMSRWTPKAFEWPKQQPKHVNYEANVNSTPNVAYKGRHAAKIGEHVLQLLDVRSATKAFLGQDGKSTGGKHALRNTEASNQSTETQSEAATETKELQEPGRHRAEPSATRDFDRKPGGKHKK